MFKENDDFSKIAKIFEELRVTRETDKIKMPNLYNSFTDDEKTFTKAFMKEASKYVDTDLIIFNIKSNCINFKYKEMQIGRIVLNDSKRRMQILTPTDVIWIENIALEDAIINIEKWIIYLKYLIKH